MSDGQTCGAPREGKGPCESRIIACDDCGRCWAHCEHVTDDERAAARERGGQATAKKNSKGPRKVHRDDLPGGPPETAAEAKMWTAWALYAVAAGRIGEKQAHEIGYLCRAFLSSLQKAEYDERMEEMEDELARLKDDPDLSVA